jgi:hypothetical protein
MWHYVSSPVIVKIVFLTDLRSIVYDHSPSVKCKNVPVSVPDDGKTRNVVRASVSPVYAPTPLAIDALPDELTNDPLMRVILSLLERVGTDHT